MTIAANDALLPFRGLILDRKCNHESWTNLSGEMSRFLLWLILGFADETYREYMAFNFLKPRQVSSVERCPRMTSMVIAGTRALITVIAHITH